MMTIQEIKNLVAGKDYDFLRTDPHLGDRIILLTLGGSHAYGTNTDTSDVDVRGCTMNSPNELIGLSNFEQIVHEATDTTVYAFNKLIKLFMSCNPNCIEMLGCKPEHYIFLTPLGQQLIDNRKIFLSKRCIYSFGGYANQQLRRLENAICHDALEQAKKEEHMLASMRGSMRSFADRYENFDYGSLRLFTGESDKEDMEKEIFVDVHMDRYPVREFNGIINELRNIATLYDKLNGRNHKKDTAHLNKHAMHLFRLYLMAFDLLENEEIVTYREAEHDMLMDVRNGKYANPDGTYRSEFFDIVNDFEKRLEYDKENTSLPEKPNFHKIEEFVMDVNRRAING